MPDFMAPANILGMIAQGGGPYGPDWNAVNNNQRTAILQQKQQQEMEGVNALKWAYSDPSHYDPKTMQPTPEVMAGVMQRSPAAGMDLTNNLVALQQKRALASNQQSTVMKHWHDRDLEIKKEAMDAYNGALDNGADPGKAQQIGQEVVSKGIEALKAEGLPPDMAQRVNPNFDALRYRRDLLTVPQQAAMENLKKEGYQVETQVINGLPTRVWVAPGKPTLDMAGKEITTTGTPAPTKASEPNLYTVTVPGKGDVTAVPDAGGFREYGGAGNLLPGATNPRKVGTKGEGGGEVKVLGDETKTGDEYLATLPTGERNVVDLMVQGKSPPVSAFAMKSPDMQRMLAEARQADPTFDQTTWGKRYGVMKSYSSGKDHTDLVSFNTAINHAGALWKSAQELDNFGGVLTPLNPLKEFMQSHTGDPRYKVFNQNAHALAEELERAFRGTGGNVSSIQEWRKSLDEAGSPAQIEAAIGKAMELLSGRIGAKRDDFARSMGPSANFAEFITPTSQRAIATLPGGKAIAETAGIAPTAPASSAPAAAPSGASAAPHGDTIEPPPRPAAGSGTPAAIPPPADASWQKSWPAWGTGKTGTPAGGKPIPIARDDGEKAKLIQLMPPNQYFIGPDNRMYLTGNH